MKARHIKKLRNLIPKMHVFKIRTCWGLFGFDSFHQNKYTEIKGLTKEKALKRYFKKLMIKERRIHPFSDCINETSYIWGKVEVLTESGFHYYFN